jgi:hypothetical protein
MNDRDLNEAMDACRPNSDDLQLPELQRLAAALESDPPLRQSFEQRQQIDQRVAETLRRVAISPARRARLVAAARGAEAAGQEGSAATDSLPTPARPSRPGARPPRRRFLTAAAIGLAALSVLLLATLTLGWLNPWRSVGPQQLARWAMQDWLPQPGAWKPMNQLSRAQHRTLSRYLRMHPARWQPLATHLDDQALIFDLPGHRQATRLFVLRAGWRVKRLPTSPPQQPQTSYEGQLFAAWQEASHVYVLSVAGTTQHYRDVVHTPGHSLAKSAAAGMLAE